MGLAGKEAYHKAGLTVHWDLRTSAEDVKEMDHLVTLYYKEIRKVLPCFAGSVDLAAAAHQMDCYRAMSSCLLNHVQLTVHWMADGNST